MDQQWQLNLAFNREEPQAGPDSCREGKGPVIPAITGCYSAVNLYCAKDVVTFDLCTGCSMLESFRRF